MDTLDLTRQVRDAHGDAWQVLGRLRVPHGGDCAELPGIRLMSSGLQHPQWNNGDVTDSRLVDIEQVRAWYATRGVPWGGASRSACRGPKAGTCSRRDSWPARQRLSRRARRPPDA